MQLSLLINDFKMETILDYLGGPLQSHDPLKAKELQQRRKSEQFLKQKKDLQMEEAM